MASQQRKSQQGDRAPQIGSMQFARVARALGEAASRGGLVVPAFRSPPRQTGVRRAMQRRTDGSVTVSVALRDRPWLAVQADMIDGVLAANEFTDAQRGEWRDRLFGALTIVDVSISTGDGRGADSEGVPQAA